MEVNQHFSDTFWSVTGFILWIVGFVYLYFTIPTLKSPTIAIISWIIIVSIIVNFIGKFFSYAEGLAIVLYVIDMTLFTMYFLPVGFWKFFVETFLNLFTSHGAMSVNTAYYIALLMFGLGTFFIVHLLTEFYYNLAKIDVQKNVKEAGVF